MENEIGQKIKQLRRAKEMTLKELAEKSDLSISFLSMVERGVTSAALLSLKRIADALEEDISVFFVGQERFQTGGFCRSYDNNVRSISARCVYKSLARTGENCILDPMEVLLMPGQTRDEVIQITHSGEEFTYVLEGVLSYFLNGQEYVMNPGDSYHGFGNEPHNFVNLTNRVVRVLYIVTPPLSNMEQEKVSQMASAEIM